jgi:hypothetical protein
VLIKGAALNNTDINTASNKEVMGTLTAADGPAEIERAEASELVGRCNCRAFRGADRGTVVAAGAELDPARIGERVIVRPMQQSPETNAAFNCVTLWLRVRCGSVLYGARRRKLCGGLFVPGDVRLASLPLRLPQPPRTRSNAQGLKAGEQNDHRVLVACNEKRY